MVRVVVTDRVRVRKDALPVACVAELLPCCEHKNPRRDAARRGGSAWWHKIPETIPTYREEGTWLTFPRGAWHKLAPVLRRHVAFEVDDRRSMGDPRLALHVELDPSITLRGYQERMIEAGRVVENCVLRAPTGSGKSLTGLGLVAALQVPSLVVVPTAGILRQWRREVGEKLSIPLREVGQIGDSKWEVRPVTVALYHSLASRKAEFAKLRDAFGLQLFDEVQDAGAERAFAVADALSARWRVGVSAHEKRKDLLQSIVYDAFGEVACEVDEDEVEEAGGVVPVYGVVYPTRFRADWYVSTRDAIPDRAAISGRAPETYDDDFDRLLKEMSLDGERTAMAVGIADECLRKGGVVVVLTRRHEHVDRLRAQLRALGHEVGFLAGGKKGEFDRALHDLRDGSLRCAVGTVEAFGKGMDVPPLTDVVCAMPIAANVSMLKQAKGRASRPHPPSGKRAGRFHYLLDVDVFGDSHERAVRAMFKGRYERRAA